MLRDVMTHVSSNEELSVSRVHAGPRQPEGESKTRTRANQTGFGRGGGRDLLTPRPEGGGRALGAGRFNRGETDGRKEVR